jgi:hypothetical protein
VPLRALLQAAAGVVVPAVRVVHPLVLPQPQPRVAEMLLQAGEADVAPRRLFFRLIAAWLPS